MEYSRYVRPYKTIALYLLVLVVSAAALVFGLVPIVKQAFKLYQDTQTLAIKVSALRQKVRMLQSLDEESLRNQLLALVSAVPANKSLPSLFATVEGVSAQSGVSLIDLSVTAAGPLATDAAKRLTIEEKKLGVSILPFSVGVEGQPAQLRSFMEVSANVRRFYQIRQAQINFSPEGLARGRFETSAYYTPFPASLGEVTEALEPLGAKEEQIIAAVSAIPQAAAAEVAVSTAPLPLKADPFSP